MVIQEEMEKLLEAGLIREVEYPEWLANVVVVPKKGGKWRVCVGYTNLNDACPKDSFPLPRINQIVDATFGHEMLSFLDAFSGYHQILMALEDEEKTSFITPHGLYCYRVMSFRLKNASWQIYLCLLSLHSLNDFGKGLWSSKPLFFMNLSFQKLCHNLSK